MKDPSGYVNHRQRLRDRFRKASTEGMHAYEVLELLLTYVIPRKDVKPIAKKLLDHFGSINGLLDSGPQEIEKIAGIGPQSSLLIRLVKELCCLYLSEKMQKKNFVSSPDAVVDFARMKLSGLPYESFMVIYLNVRNEVTSYEILEEGTVDHAVIYPRRIIESALRNHAVNLVIFHNHPSGHCEPSVEDKRLTHALSQAARTVEICLLDHVIVGKNGAFSFAENNLLNSEPEG